jgi:choline dehydrogenase-like flavoprotein
MRGKSVLVLEAGPEVRNDQLGTMWAAAVHPGYFNRMAVFSRSVESSVIYHTSNVGGSTVFACGNMIRKQEVEERLAAVFGLTGLSECFDEAEEETFARPLPTESLVGASKKLMEEAQGLGYSAKPASKGLIDGTTCKGCGKCVLGCQRGAKWDSRRYLASAVKRGATLRSRTRVNRVLLEGGKAAGVVVEEKEIIKGRVVILAAGAMNTPVILQRSGIEAGAGLFVDYFKCVYGMADKGTQLKGQTMAFLAEAAGGEQDFMISPFVDDPLQYALFCPFSWQIRGGFFRTRVMGLMVKIADERSGTVRPNGKIRKKPTQADRIRMGAGLKAAAKILEASGAKDIATTAVWRGAHPGGTAAMGEVVDCTLEVHGIERLYVCDASVLPFAPGRPPILTITAIGKWLGKRL